jgi:hypothetical protein
MRPRASIKGFFDLGKNTLTVFEMNRLRDELAKEQEILNLRWSAPVVNPLSPQTYV